jgi:hypothetical protein
MTGGPLKQNRIGVPISFPIVVPSAGTSVTRGIVKVRKPSGGEQSWTCSVSGVSTATAVTLLHITEAGDLDESGTYGWTAYLYDGASNATDLVYETLDQAARPPTGLVVIIPLTTLPT